MERTSGTFSPAQSLDIDPPASALEGKPPQAAKLAAASHISLGGWVTAARPHENECWDGTTPYHLISLAPCPKKILPERGQAAAGLKSSFRLLAREKFAKKKRIGSRWINPSMYHKRIKKMRYAGVLPFRFSPKGLEILLITTRRTGRWIIPKGRWECSLKSYESAEKEAYEEAGIEGMIGRIPIGLYKQKSARGATITPIVIFPLQVTYAHGTWPEQHERVLRWVGADFAERLVERSLGRLIRQFARNSLVKKKREARFE